MKQTHIPPVEYADPNNQVINYANQLSALYSIPLIESLYDNGFSVKQLQNLEDMISKLTSLNRNDVAFKLFLALYDLVPIERPIALCTLPLFPAPIQNFLSEFLEDLDSLIDEFLCEESEDAE